MFVWVQVKFYFVVLNSFCFTFGSVLGITVHFVSEL